MGEVDRGGSEGGASGLHAPEQPDSGGEPLAKAEFGGGAESGRNADEASRVSDSMYKALRPMLAVTDGDLWLMSTPNGKQGFFHEVWEHGGADWLRLSVPATECDRIGKEFLEEERRELGALWFRQEYLCEFVDNGTGIFRRGCH